MFKKKAPATRQAQAEAPAGPAEPLAGPVQAAAASGDAVRSAPRIDTFGAPAVLQMATAVPDRGDWLPSFLLDKAASSDTIDVGTFLPIVLPGLNPPREDKRAASRKRKGMPGDVPNDLEENA
jgi:hypothetical protein